VQVKDGVAKLSGVVDNVLEKNWAQTDAWVPGVRQVDASGLRVQFAPDGWRKKPVTAGPVSDEQIRRMVKRQYVYDPRVYSTQPEVEVQDGVVTLSGTVFYRSAKRAAAEIARHVGGVKKVIDRLEVRPPLPRPSDDEIAAAIRTSLEMNSLVDADDVNAKVNEGAVVLTGTVLDPLAKWTAEDLADRTAGVVAVENNLRAAHEPLPGVAQYTFPRGYAFQPTFPAVSRLVPTTDADLANAVRGQLAFSPLTDLTQIRVSARGDVVTLEGEVESHVARQAAADHAFQAGAKDVINQLRVPGASE
jgi:osmotically-inducible protein OsmY